MEAPQNNQLTDDELLEAELHQELQRISADIKTILDRVATADPALRTQAEATAVAQGNLSPDPTVSPPSSPGTLSADKQPK